MKIEISNKAREQLEKEFGGKTVRIFPYRKSWAGVIYDLAQDEPREDDNVYEIGSVKLVVNKKIESYVETININYESYDWGEDYVIVTRY